MTAELTTMRTPVAPQGRVDVPRRKRPKGRLGTILNTTAMAVIALISTGPFIWLLFSSVKLDRDVGKLSLIGSEIRWANFTDAFELVPFGQYIVNGLLVATLGTALVVLVSVLGAYAFARLTFRGRDKLFLAYLGTLLLPQEILVIPMYMLMRELGLIDSYTALIVPWAFGAFGTFLLRQFMLTVPAELEDAARIDGAGRIRILFTVHLPLIRPALAVLAVFTFINYWNSFLWPLIVTNSPDKLTVPVGLNYFTTETGTAYGPLLAGCLLSVLPCVVLVVAMQRHLVKGLTLGAFGGR